MMPYPGLGGVSEWERKVLAIVVALANLLDSTSDPLRIWMRNGMEVLLMGTEPGAIVPTGELTREETMMYSALFQAALAFRDTPIPVYLDAEGQPVILTPDQVIGYRRVPAPPAPETLGVSDEERIGPPFVPLISLLPTSAPGAAAIPQRPNEAPR